jgi:hypothetical protein
MTGWLYESPQQVVTLDVLSMKEQELQREVLMLRRCIRKLLALLRLLVVLLRISGFSLANERVPGERPRLHCCDPLTLFVSFCPFGPCCVSCASLRLATIRGQARGKPVASTTDPVWSTNTAEI